MKKPSWVVLPTVLVVMFGGWTSPRAEVIEEIVALVNGDIITKSDLETEEQVMISEIYRRFTGEDLDQRVEAVRKNLLLELIDRKMLFHFAERSYDVERLGSALYESFKAQQNIQSDEEFERMLANEGMTLDDLKKRLLETFAPEEVLRFEVRSRVSVADTEVDAFYAENPDRFVLPDEVTVREIVLLADDEAKRDARRDEIAAVRQRLASGDFAEVAKQVSEAGTKESGGLLGVVKRGDLSEQLEQVAFNIETGAISDPLETPYGFHILKIESRQVGESVTLDEIRDDLRAALEEKQYTEDLVAFMERIRSESEWCIKPGYKDRVPGEAGAAVCEEM